MKNIFKKALLSVALLTAVAVEASELNDIKISEAKNLNISLSKVVNGEILSITNKEGETLYNEILVQDDLFTVSIDFSKFTQGVYHMKSVIGSVTKITPLIIVPQQSKVIQGETRLYNTPVITFENNNVTNIAVENSTHNPVSIMVVQGSHELSLTKESTNALITKSYNTLNLSGGQYKIIVMQGDDYIFTKDMNI